jgi:hypothetical protein
MVTKNDDRKDILKILHNHNQQIFQYISNKMQPYTVYLYLETAVQVSGGTSTHHHECIQLYLQHLVFVTPLLLPAAPTVPGETARNKFLNFKLSPCSEFYMPTFRNTLSVSTLYLLAYEDGTDRVFQNVSI